MSAPSALLDGFFYRPDEDTRELLGLLPEEAEVAPQQPEEPREEYLAFVLEDEHYAVPLRAVREIVKVPPLTEVPRAVPNLLGVIHLRGEVLPVYDIKVRLRLAERPAHVAGPEAPPPPRGARIIVIQGEEGPAGVWVDSVSEVVRLLPSRLEPAPPGVGGGERDCVAGLARRRPEELFILLDIHQALS